eukprot:Nk52_evm81s554 gene=Nk52_evmTU81s554
MAPYTKQECNGRSLMRDSSALSELKYEDTKYVPGKGVRPRSKPMNEYQIDWIVAPTLLLSPVVAMIGAFFIPLQEKTFLFAVIMYYCCGIGITGGYHRLWAHRAFDAAWPLELFFAVFGGASMQGSARWWCRNHRAHHKFTDTTKDPYDVIKSFWWAHIGWMLVKQDRSEVGRADISDLDLRPIVRWQHKYYVFLVIFVGLIFPGLFAGYFWGDYMGGWLYAGLCRLIFVHHSTFFVNSLAHYLGEQPYSDYHTSCDSFITALVSLGEGYHNYHHEFPQDYRNGIRWYHFDPTKWFVIGCYYLGLAYNLRYVPENEIQKALYQQKKSILMYEKGLLLEKSHGLPSWTMEDIKEMIQESKGEKLLLIVAGKVYDVSTFGVEHPGGLEIMKQYNGTDVTKEFKGVDCEYHIHSVRTVEKLLPRFLVARFEESSAREYGKKEI